MRVTSAHQRRPTKPHSGNQLNTPTRATTSNPPTRALHVLQPPTTQLLFEPCAARCDTDAFAYCSPLRGFYCAPHLCAAQLLFSLWACHRAIECNMCAPLHTPFLSSLALGTLLVLVMHAPDYCRGEPRSHWGLGEPPLQPCTSTFLTRDSAAEDVRMHYAVLRCGSLVVAAHCHLPVCPGYRP